MIIPSNNFVTITLFCMLTLDNFECSCFLPCSDDVIYEVQYYRDQTQYYRDQTQEEGSTTSMALRSRQPETSQMWSIWYISGHFACHGSAHTPQINCFVYLFLSIIFQVKRPCKLLLPGRQTFTQHGNHLCIYHIYVGMHLLMQ